MDVQIGKGITLPVNANGIPPNVLEHVLYIGLRNILMDSHAGVATTEADYVAKATAIAEKKLAALMAGEVRVASTREGDPVRVEALRIATDRIKAALRKAGRKVADVDPKALRAKAVELVAKDPAILEMAAKRVAEAKAETAPDELTAGL